MKDFSHIKVIGFDLDQTLYPKSQEIDAAIQKYLHSKISEFLSIKEAKAKDLFESLYLEGKGLSGSAVLKKIGFPSNTANQFIQEALENASITQFLKYDRNVIELLKNLKKKFFALDIITGSNLTNTLAKLNKLRIDVHLFSNIITSDIASKSDLSAFKKWMSLYPELNSYEFLYLGDRVSSDYEKPKMLGINSILVNITDRHDDIDCLQLPSLINVKNHLF